MEAARRDSSDNLIIGNERPVLVNVEEIRYLFNFLRSTTDR